MMKHNDIVVTTMINKHDNISDGSREDAEEIQNEIIKMLSTEDNVVNIPENNVLSLRLGRLIALGSALANQQSYDVAFCVRDCLKTGATKQEVIKVLRLAIEMAEIPVETYTIIVRDAIESFEAGD